MRHRVLNNARTQWTPEKEQQLLTLFAEGLHKSEVAAQMGTSISSVEARYRKLKAEG